MHPEFCRRCAACQQRDRLSGGLRAPATIILARSAGLGTALDVVENVTSSGDGMRFLDLKMSKNYDG